MIPSISVSGHNKRLALSDSEHRVQILQQLRTTLTSITTCCPTTWSRQHWP